MRQSAQENFQKISFLNERSLRRYRVMATVMAAFVAPVVLPLVSPQRAVAQTDAINIAYPQPNSVVKGATKVLFSGIPDGGHVAVYVDLTPTNRAQSFREATKLGSFVLDTSSLSDGPHTLTLVAFSAASREVDRKSVTFTVANAGAAGVSEDSVQLVNWLPQDMLNPKVQRYRVFAVSDAIITGGQSAGMSGGPGGVGSPDGSGGSSGQAAAIPAPLDYQVDLFIRRTIRDVAMMEGSANVRLIVQEGFQRSRKDKEGGGASSKRKAVVSGKAPWGEWSKSPESSQAYTKMIQANGREINATRKPATLPLGDILPEFPSYRVQPGATWDGNVLVVGELTKRLPFRLQGVPLSFSGFDNIQTPAGIERRAAKIEISNFSLPEDVAMRIARALQTEAGGTGASGGSSGGTSVGMAGMGGGEAEPPAITVARSELTRTIWFDIASNQLLRSEDVVNSYYEEAIESPNSGTGGPPPGFGIPPGFGGPPPGFGGPSAGAPTIPKSVTYNLRVVKFLDDRLPNPTNTFNGGIGTAHTRDSVRDPSIDKANGNLVNNR